MLDEHREWTFEVQVHTDDMGDPNRDQNLESAYYGRRRLADEGGNRISAARSARLRQFQAARRVSR
jgi:hypothetical protein